MRELSPDLPEDFDKEFDGWFPGINELASQINQAPDVTLHAPQNNQAPDISLHAQSTSAEQSFSDGTTSSEYKTTSRSSVEHDSSQSTAF